MIAIVDDDRSAREALERLVRSLGHKASTFGSAEEFLKSGKLNDTSCLITDLQMPGLTGGDPLFFGETPGGRGKAGGVVLGGPPDPPR